MGSKNSKRTEGSKEAAAAEAAAQKTAPPREEAALQAGTSKPLEVPADARVATAEQAPEEAAPEAGAAEEVTRGTYPVVERLTPEQVAAMEAEEARQFQEAVEEWRRERAAGAGAARVVEAGGAFARSEAAPAPTPSCAAASGAQPAHDPVLQAIRQAIAHQSSPVTFPTSVGSDAGRWCPDGRGYGTHCHVSTNWYSLRR